MLILVLLPLIIGLICFFIPKGKIIGYLSFGGNLVLSLIAIQTFVPVIDKTYLKEGIFYADAFSVYIASIVIFLSLLATGYSIEYLEDEINRGLIGKKYVQRFYLLLNAFISSMLLVVLTDNLAVMWIAIEATTIISAPLIGFGFAKRELAIEAAWKYIILCTVGITFALLGVFIAYYASSNAFGENGSLSFVVLRDYAQKLNPMTMKLAFIFVLVGYGTKAGLAPLHSWLPDAHSQAPTPVSALLSGILLNTAFYGIVRFFAIIHPITGIGYTSNLLTIFGLISIGISSFFILTQTNFKRMLAYSSIEHMGIISLGFGIGSKLSIYGALLHILNHAIAKPLMFFVSGKIQSRFGSTSIENVCGVISKMPVLGVLTFIGLFSLVGTPPFNIFLSEFSIMKSAAETGKWFPLGLFLFFIIFIFLGMLAGFSRMLFSGECKDESLGQSHKATLLATSISYGVMIFLALLTIILGVHIPDFIDNLIKNSLTVLGVN